MPVQERTNYSCLKPLIDKVVRWYAIDLMHRFVDDSSISYEDLVSNAFEVLQCFEVQLDVKLDCEYVLPDMNLEWIPIDLACELNNRRFDFLEVKK